MQPRATGVFFLFFAFLTSLICYVCGYVGSIQPNEMAHVIEEWRFPGATEQAGFGYDSKLQVRLFHASARFKDVWDFYARKTHPHQKESSESMIGVEGVLDKFLIANLRSDDIRSATFILRTEARTITTFISCGKADTHTNITLVIDRPTMSNQRSAKGKHSIAGKKTRPKT